MAATSVSSSTFHSSSKATCLYSNYLPLETVLSKRKLELLPNNIYEYPADVSRLLGSCSSASSLSKPTLMVHCDSVTSLETKYYEPCQRSNTNLEFLTQRKSKQLKAWPGNKEGERGEVPENEVCYSPYFTDAVYNYRLISLGINLKAKALELAKMPHPSHSSAQPIKASSTSSVVSSQGKSKRKLRTLTETEILERLDIQMSNGWEHFCIVNNTLDCLFLRRAVNYVPSQVPQVPQVQNKRSRNEFEQCTGGQENFRRVAYRGENGQEMQNQQVCQVNGTWAVVAGGAVAGLKKVKRQF